MIALNGNEFYGVGATIKAGFADAVQIARKTGQVVRLKWNGETTPVTYSDTADSLMRAWSRKNSRSKAASEWRKRRRKQSAQTRQKARRIAATLPNYLFAWALDSERFYGKALSILMAADALDIAKRYGTAEAIQEAFNAGTLETVADSGASHGMTAQMAHAIASSTFPGQPQPGIVPTGGDYPVNPVRPENVVLVVKNKDGREIGRIAAIAPNATAYLNELAQHYKEMSVDYEEDKDYAMLSRILNTPRS